MAYDHRAIEQRWQAYWDDNGTFRTTRRPGRPKYYVLDMFPYPSGAGLHVGHPVGYIATDIYARYKRMRGFDVLHPMGWDAFGLPAEQHAINTGTHPRVTTRDNIETFRRQLKMLGFSYDWSREIDTTDPRYVRWTQWIFLKLFERGLATQAEIPVNWCPELGTVLANEEVVDGRSERGGFPVIRQPLRQWQLRITAYADRLASDLEMLDWPESKQKQLDWIGKSEGAEVDFPIVGRGDKLTVYTTRPDTLFGATYMVIAPDHRLTRDLASPDRRAEVNAYADAAARKSDMERTALNKEKTGVFTGAHATNPLNGKEIPIFTADYVLGAYGTGAIMAVPAHDERDYEFARAFQLPIVEVVRPSDSPASEPKEAFTGDGISVNSGKFDGLPTPEMKRRITLHLEREGIGRRTVNYKLRDWVFSRQRYWGEPIPIYFPVETSGDPRKGDPHSIDYSKPIACEERELPLLLPELDDYLPGDPHGPLARALDWRFFQRNGRWYARETNTMPQWAGSCWYYLRFVDPGNDARIFGEQAYDDWMPVDLYIGGAEHTVLHLLYARFWHKALYDVGVVKHPEPFMKLVHQGMMLGQAYRWYAVLDETGNVVRALDGDDPEVVYERELGKHFVGSSREAVEAKWLGPSEVRFNGEQATHPKYGVKLVAIAEKMSKSRGNVVNPDPVVEEFGADSLRVYEMFMGPLDQVKPWQTSGIQGVRRFLDRVHAVATKPHVDAIDSETERLMHKTIKKVTEDTEALRYNTAISSMMILANHLVGLDSPPAPAIDALTLCLSPYAPHLSEELWQLAGRSRGFERTSLAEQPWPVFDPSLCVDDEVEIPVQVNGKVRGKVRLPPDSTEETVREAALKDENVRKHLTGKAIRKVVYVRGRILNVIVG
jgi:leucyl-tRNA synthetase